MVRVAVQEGFEGTFLVTEQERMDGKLERLLLRNEKILFEIMKSRIGKKSKVELLDDRQAV